MVPLYYWLFPVVPSQIQLLYVVTLYIWYSMYNTPYVKKNNIIDFGLQNKFYI